MFSFYVGAQLYFLEFLNQSKLASVLESSILKKLQPPKSLQARKFAARCVDSNRWKLCVKQQIDKSKRPLQKEQLSMQQRKQRSREVQQQTNRFLASTAASKRRNKGRGARRWRVRRKGAQRVGGVCRGAKLAALERQGSTRFASLVKVNCKSVLPANRKAPFRSGRSCVAWWKLSLWVTKSSWWFESSAVRRLGCWCAA